MEGDVYRGSHETTSTHPMGLPPWEPRQETPIKGRFVARLSTSCVSGKKAGSSRETTPREGLWGTLLRYLVRVKWLAHNRDWFARGSSGYKSHVAHMPLGNRYWAGHLDLHG